VSLSNGEAYLANKEGALTLSVLRSPRIVGEAGFTLHEIRFTRTGFQAISPRTVMNNAGKRTSGEEGAVRLLPSGFLWYRLFPISPSTEGAI
jgi:hypothetical protein